MVTIEDIRAYQISFDLSQVVWNTATHWDYFAKDTIGKQYVRAIDSISANIAEGFGRYNKKDKVRFYRYAYGSVQESMDWTKKARLRGLITDEEHDHILSELSKLPVEINYLIKQTVINLKN